MAAAIEYTDEQLNYYRICYVTTDILAEGLRSIFKQEWDKLYKATLGEWKDEPRNGLEFKNRESPQNQRRNAHQLRIMVNGNRTEWDCTMLFYAILFSDCIHSLHPTSQSNVDNLRKFRNEEFAHMPQGQLSDVDFQNAIGKVHAAFLALGLSTLQIQEIRNQKSFPTEELAGVLKKVDDLKQELQERENDLQEKEKDLQEKEKDLQLKEEQRQVLEDQLQSDISSFCILPPKPSHEVTTRDSEVAEITQRLKELKGANENSLSYLYISGNPGSGKSQLAGLVAKRFFNEVKEIPSEAASSFVMTLNAESPETLLESYVSFARHLKCPEYAVTNTVNSKDLKTDEKITNLKTLISSKIELYTSWLLVVDNVTSIYRVHGHLPESGNEQWVRGQLLITTQDTASIPLTSSFIQHISVSKGMGSHNASSLLAKLSGIANSEMEKEVALALDYQPLALASAGIYIRQVRRNKATSNFGWNDYLKKLDAGQRGTTEAIHAETNPCYQKSMTTATTLAVERQISSDRVIDHTFRFLYLCAPQPLSLDIVINYILNVDEEIKDKEMIMMRIQRCSLLLFEEEETGVYIRVHQVVHDVINTVITDLPEIQRLQVVNGALKSFNQVIDENLDSKHIVPHLGTIIIKIEQLCSKQNISQVVQSGIFNIQAYPRYIQKLGQMCSNHCDFYAAKKYFYKALEFLQLSDVHSDVHVAYIYVFIGTVHSHLGELQQAKEYHDRALAIHLKKLGPEHINVASSYSNLGTVHSHLGELQQAKEYHDRALAIYLKKLGPEHIDVASTYNNLGTLHSNLGELQQAKEYHDRTLAIFLKTFGPEHVNVATTYNNLGTLHSNLGELLQAKEYHDRALAIFLKTFGPEHVNVTTVQLSLIKIKQRIQEMAVLMCTLMRNSTFF